MWLVPSAVGVGYVVGLSAVGAGYVVGPSALGTGCVVNRQTTS